MISWLYALVWVLGLPAGPGPELAGAEAVASDGPSTIQSPFAVPPRSGSSVWRAWWRQGQLWPSHLAINEGARKVLSRPEYQFCHDEKYPLFSDERAWCPLIGDPVPACPALPAACRARISPCEGKGTRVRFGPGKERRSRRGRAGQGDECDCEDQGGSGSKGDGTSGKPDENQWARGKDSNRAAEQPKEPTPPTRRDKVRPSPLMSGFSTVLFFGLIALGAAFIIWLIVRNFVSGDDPDSSEQPPETAASEQDPQPAAGPVETDVTRLLDSARRAAAAGDYERAIADAYAALLRRLDGDGLIELHRSSTNGDYVRHVASNPLLGAELRNIVRDVETIQFGHGAATRGLFDSLFARILPLATQALLFVLMLLSLTVSSSCDPSTGSEAPAPLAKGSTGPSGSRALADMLAANGVDVSYRVRPLSELPTEPHTLVLLRDPTEEQWDELLAWVRNIGGKLVIAGFTPPEHVGMEPVWYVGKRTQLTATSGYTDSFGELDLMVPPNSALRVTNEHVHNVLLRGAQPYAATRFLGSGTITLFADDYLFTNLALLAGDNSDFMQGFLSVDNKVEFCNEWTGAGAVSPLESVHRARLTPVVLQALVLLAILFLFRGIAFGRPRDPRQHSRRSFTDHVRALGLRYGRARASEHVLGLYAGWAIDRLRERFVQGQRTGLAELAEAIAARTGLEELDVLQVLVDGQCARDGIGAPSYRPMSVRDQRVAAPIAGSVADDFEVMRQLARFLAVTSRSSQPRSNSSYKK